MFKRVLTIAVLTAGITCFAASAIRIEINGISNKVVVKPGKAGKGLRIANAHWLKDNNKYFLVIASGMNIPEKWQKYTFSFTPETNGVVNIYFRGAWHKPKGAKKNLEVWVAYDNITVTGTEAVNSDFEFVNQKNLFNGWTGNGANMVTGPKEAQSGKNYIIVWHNNPVYQTLKLKKGQEVTITFYAKASDGLAKK